MSVPEQHWWSVRAGEYVLGTLRGTDLALFEKILAHDSEIQAEVAQWEQRLSGLNETTATRTPNERVFPEILERIRATPSATEGDEAQTSAEIDAQPLSERENFSDVQNVVAIRSAQGSTPDLSLSPGRWQSFSGLATAASLLMGIILFQGFNSPSSLPLNVDGLSVVLSDEDGKPFFLVETDYDDLRVRVTALRPPSLDDSSNFQLWQALPDRSSVRPVAQLPEEPGASRVFNVESLVVNSDLFGVSIEPLGAQTEEGPTGPVVAHGDFLPKKEAK